MSHVVPAALPLAFVVSEVPDEEAGLVARAQARDPRAFEQLYRRHVNRVHAVCRRIAADATRAEELTQTAFLAAWHRLPLFRGESAFATWLHRVAVNTALADLRAEQRRARRLVGTDDPAAWETPAAGSPAGTRLDLETAIATLPRQARAVFVLHDVEGWRHDEIAAALGLATGTSKAQLHRARQLLREILA